MVGWAMPKHGKADRHANCEPVPGLAAGIAPSRTRAEIDGESAAVAVCNKLDLDRTQGLGTPRFSEAKASDTVLFRDEASTNSGMQIDAQTHHAT